jgi:hypothetical protein
MNTLERLQELNATTGKRNGDEDLGHWADREKRENMWVRDVALPLLLEVVEAAKVVKETYSAVMSDPVASDIDAEFGCLADAWNHLDAALAKLEGEV